jgi:hypothetical protein
VYHLAIAFRAVGGNHRRCKHLDHRAAGRARAFILEHVHSNIAALGATLFRFWRVPTVLLHRFVLWLTQPSARFLSVAKHKRGLALDPLDVGHFMLHSFFCC